MVAKAAVADGPGVHGGPVVTPGGASGSAGGVVAFGVFRRRPPQLRRRAGPVRSGLLSVTRSQQELEFDPRLGGTAGRRSTRQRIDFSTRENPFLSSSGSSYPYGGLQARKIDSDRVPDLCSLQTADRSTQAQKVNRLANGEPVRFYAVDQEVNLTPIVLDGSMSLRGRKTHSFIVKLHKPIRWPRKLGKSTLTPWFQVAVPPAECAGDPCQFVGRVLTRLTRVDPDSLKALERRQSFTLTQTTFARLYANC